MRLNIKTVIFLMSVSSLACYGEVRVPTADALKAVVKKVQPDYSPMAKQMRVQGDVEVEVKISDGGGNPLLTAPVLRSLKDWKFTPFKQEGKPSPAVTTLRFSFKM
jgi:outer membrane biosynthesis protein TonB